MLKKKSIVIGLIALDNRADVLKLVDQRSEDSTTALQDRDANVNSDQTVMGRMVTRNQPAESSDAIVMADLSNLSSQLGAELRKVRRRIERHSQMHASSRLLRSA